MNTTNGETTIHKPNYQNGAGPVKRPNLKTDVYHTNIKIESNIPNITTPSLTSFQTTNLSLSNPTLKSSPTTTASMKRGSEEISNGSSAPNKIPKYVIDQKSAS